MSYRNFYSLWYAYVTKAVAIILYLIYVLDSQKSTSQRVHLDAESNLYKIANYSPFW